jgi:predicted transglutaminase-like cysteine proteinase
MLLRIAAWWLAAFLIVVPASAGVETGTVANANVSAVAIAIDAPLNLVAMAPDVPQEKIEVKALDTNRNQAEHQANIEAPIQTNIQAVVQIDTNLPAKLAALEPVAPDMPKGEAPQAELPRNDLPHIDASFRFDVLPVSGGDVLAKWNGVKADMRAESEIFARCRAIPDSCPAAAKRFLGIVDQGRALTGRARIGVINRAVNMAIEPVSDMAQWGVPDRWSAPLETFTTRKGDCEDYAIAKYVALTEAGIAAEDVKLIIVHNIAANEDHAVTAVRLDGAWIILDNRWLKLVEDRAMAEAVPLFALDSDGVRQFLPDVLVGARRAPAPASISN